MDDWTSLSGFLGQRFCGWFKKTQCKVPRLGSEALWYFHCFMLMMVVGRSSNRVNYNYMATVMMVVTASPGGKPGWTTGDFSSQRQHHSEMATPFSGFSHHFWLPLLIDCQEILIGHLICLLDHCLVEAKFHQLRQETAEVSMCSTWFHDIIHDVTDKSDISVFPVLDCPVPSLLSSDTGDMHKVLGTSSSISETCALDAMFSGQSSMLWRGWVANIFFLRANMYLIGRVPRQRKENPSVFSLLISWQWG